MGLMLAGMSGVPVVASLQWWTTRGPCATTGREVARTMLWYAQHTWGRLLLHIFDRGFAGLPWLLVLVESQLRFVLRWPGRYKLLGPRTGWQPTKAWEIVMLSRFSGHLYTWG